MIAARVAADLNTDPDTEARIVRGAIGELSVVVDGERIVKTNPFWYPLPSQVIKKARAKMQDKK